MSKVIMKSNTSMILVIALAAIVFSAACSKNANTGNSTNSTNSSTTNKTSTTSPSDTSSGPTAALRAYWEAGMRKDVQAAKRYLSAGTMTMLEDGAKKMGKTLDEALQESANQTPTTEMPEFSNEQISGDTATVDVKTQDMPPVTMPMVREGGEWKLALDKMFEEMRKSMGGTQSKGPGDANDNAGEGNHNGGH